MGPIRLGKKSLILMYRNNTFLNISLFFFLISLFLISIYAIVLMEATLSGYIRFDKYYINFSVYTFLFYLLPLVVAIFVAKHYCVGKHFFLSPTIVFYLLFFILVLPGVIFTAPSNAYGLKAQIGFTFSIILFSIGVVFSSKILKFKPNKEIKNYYDSVEKISTNGQTIKWVSIVSIISLVIIFIEASPLTTKAINGIIYFIKSGLVPSESEEILRNRLSMYSETNNYKGAIINYVQKMILPICSIFFIVYGKKNNKKFTG